MTDDTTKNVQRLVDKLKPDPTAIERAKQMLEQSLEMAPTTRSENAWTAPRVTSVLKPLIEEYEQLRSALAEALDELQLALNYMNGNWVTDYDRESARAKVAELRKLVTP